MNTRRAGEILLRGLKLRCPDCGQGALYRSLLQMEHHCRYCGLVYEREQGYFIGAVYLNVIATESLILITLLVYFMAALTFNQTILTVLLIMAVIVPLALFRHSRSLWLCIDHLIDPSQKRVESNGASYDP